MCGGANNCGYVWNGSAWTRPVGAVVGRTVWNPAGFEYTMTATDAAVPGASVAVTSPASPLLIRAVAQLANGNSGNSSLTATMQIFEDGTAIGNPRTYFLPQVSGVNPVVTMHLLVQRTPTAGSHTYALHAKASAVSSAVIFDGAISVELN